LSQRQGCLLSPLWFSTVLKLGRAIKHDTEIKVIWIGKEEVKLSLFSEAVVWYLKDPKYSYPP
jgi:hypothetical protein